LLHVRTQAYLEDKGKPVLTVDDDGSASDNDEEQDDDDDDDPCDPQFVLPVGESEPDLLTPAGRTRAVELLLRHTYAAGLGGFDDDAARSAAIKALLLPHSRQEAGTSYVRPTLAKILEPLLAEHPPRQTSPPRRQEGMRSDFYPPFFGVFMALGGYAVDKHGATPFPLLALSADDIDEEKDRLGATGGRASSRKKADSFLQSPDGFSVLGSEGTDSSFPPSSKFMSVQVQQAKLENDKAKVKNEKEKVQNEREQISLGKVSSAFTMLERMLPHAHGNDKRAILKKMFALSQGAATNALKALSGGGEFEGLADELADESAVEMADMEDSD
jgi:hypothetical protein